MAVMDNAGKKVLKGVSRSFYLSLRLLPGPMRGAASLGYLLARTSDTLADSARVPHDLRLLHLGHFRDAVAGDEPAPRWPLVFLNAVEDVRERHLLEASGDLLAWLRKLPEGESDLVREVMETIISGQELDLKRFAGATREQAFALPDDAALEDYAWRVAGCVGAFWTRLGYHTLGERFSFSMEAELMERGIAYGKGLQLVNILRDVDEDLGQGRCYLPVADPHDREALAACHRRWLERSATWLEEGELYAATLRSRRLRTATVLPARIAIKTLESLAGRDWDRPALRVKVSRGFVYMSFMRAFMSVPTNAGR